MINMKKFLTTIAEKMEDAIQSAKYRGETTACCTCNCNDGYVDLWCDRNDSAEVVVCHSDGRVRQHPRLEDAIYNALPLWDSVETDTNEDCHSDWVRFYGRM